MPHGGHLGTVIILRPGTVLIELSCVSKDNSWVDGPMLEALEVKYIHHYPARCDTKKLDSSFETRFDRILSVLEKAIE